MAALIFCDLEKDNESGQEEIRKQLAREKENVYLSSAHCKVKESWEGGRHSGNAEEE